MIGRDKEQRQLLELLESDESQFCAVFGRRRVGKTYLIRETFNGHFAFQHTGLSHGSMGDQLGEFRESLRASGMRKCPVLRSWSEAFHNLANYLCTLPAGKKIIFLDELSWLDTPKSNFVSALEHFWNGWALARVEKDIVLIVCGSATSWLISKIVKDHGGLHNRLTSQIYLNPFTLAECEAYAEKLRLPWARRDLAECYMILGGIPYYWSFLRRTESLAMAIDRLFFEEGAPLAYEFDALYASLFRNASLHISVVNVLGTKKSGMTRGELLEHLHAHDNAVMTRVLGELEQCGFIRKYYEFGKKERGAVYQLMDNYTLFYHQFVKENRQHDSKFWSHSLGLPLHRAWAGLAFERLCLWHLPQIKHRLGIAGIVATVHSWRCGATSEHGGGQIDLVIARNDRIINLCEMKFVENEYEIDKEEAMKLSQHKALFLAETKTRYAVCHTLITSLGVAHNGYWNMVQSEVVLDDLFVQC